MEKFKGTQGPWFFETKSGKVKSDQVDCIVNVCGSSISPQDDEIDDANGILIAAAPDLLEALQSAVDILDNLSWAPDTSVMHAAIDRALGKNDGDK